MDNDSINQPCTCEPIFIFGIPVYVHHRPDCPRHGVDSGYNPATGTWEELAGCAVKEGGAEA